MPLRFDVDGKTVENPGPEEIARGFSFIPVEGMRSISIIMLLRPPVTLWAFGHPKEGYTLDISEDVEPKGTQTSKVTSPANLVPHAEIVRLFQDFARGDDSWQNQFQWEPGMTRLSGAKAMKRPAVIIVSFVLLVLIMKYVLKLF
jgi:hypothetical protein